jgi:hypothetical protein
VLAPRSSGSLPQPACSNDAAATRIKAVRRIRCDQTTLRPHDLAQASTRRRAPVTMALLLVIAIPTWVGPVPVGECCLREERGPLGCRLEAEWCADGNHWRASVLDGFDDLGVVDASQVARACAARRAWIRGMVSHSARHCHQVNSAGPPAARMRGGAGCRGASHTPHVEPDDSFSVTAVVWRPGQITRIHDRRHPGRRARGSVRVRARSKSRDRAKRLTRRSPSNSGAVKPGPPPVRWPCIAGARCLCPSLRMRLASHPDLTECRRPVAVEPAATGRAACTPPVHRAR